MNLYLYERKLYRFFVEILLKINSIGVAALKKVIKFKIKEIRI